MSGCLTAGNYLLGNKKQESWLKTGREMADVCHAMYVATPTNLAPERINLNPDAKSFSDEVTQHGGDFDKGILRPEAVEAWYYLHYFTGDPKYRVWANDYLMAMNKVARTEFGYSEIDSVWSESPRKSGNMESFVMAETVKYLYLIQSDRSTLNLSDFVLNTEAHPLKIIKEGLTSVVEF